MTPRELIPLRLALLTSLICAAHSPAGDCHGRLTDLVAPSAFRALVLQSGLPPLRVHEVKTGANVLSVLEAARDRTVSRIPATAVLDPPRGMSGLGSLYFYLFKRDRTLVYFHKGSLLKAAILFGPDGPRLMFPREGRKSAASIQALVDAGADIAGFLARDEWYNYVVDRNGTVIFGQMYDEGVKIVHPALVGGRCADIQIWGAGTFFTEGGRIKKVTRDSGHFLPGEEYDRFVLQAFRSLPRGLVVDPDNLRLYEMSGD